MTVKKLMKHLIGDYEVLYVVGYDPEYEDVMTEVCCVDCVIERHGDEKIKQFFFCDDQLVIIPKGSGITFVENNEE